MMRITTIHLKLPKVVAAAFFSLLIHYSFQPIADVYADDVESKVVNNGQVPLGINLSAFDYYSSAIPFKDLMMQKGGAGVYKENSSELCSEQPPLDSNGYPRYLPERCIFKLFSVLNVKGQYWPTGVQPYQSGDYVLLYKGKGTISLGLDAKNARDEGDGRIVFEVPEPSRGLQVVITAIDPTNPITDLHIVHADDESSFETQPFNEKWLGLLAPFKTVRFIDWGRINNVRYTFFPQTLSHTTQTVQLPVTAPEQDGIFDNMVAKITVDNAVYRILIEKYEGSTRTLYLKTPISVSTSGEQPKVYIYDFVQTGWGDRAQPTVFGQDAFKGIAFEYMIKLANTLNADPWINIPTAADDAFVEQLALLIKDNLNPGLKCHIEYSNETWNFAFPGYQYAEAKARELGLIGTEIPADAWHAYRAVEVFKIFNRVFDEADLHKDRYQSRLVRILTSQTAWLDRAKQVMDWKMRGEQWPTNGLRAHEYADAWGITAYFGNQVTPEDIENLSTDELFELQYKLVDEMFGDKKNPGLIREIFKETDKRKLKLVGYEGGTHLLAGNNSDLVAKLSAINQDQRMKDVYLQLLNQWDALYREFGEGKIGVLNHYADVFQDRKTGYWGLLQSTYQSIETAPKYQAFIEFLDHPEGK